MDTSTGIARQQRSDSNSSTTSTGSPERRRSSGLFSSLEQQKRSNNPEQIARRASMHDHKPAPGVFGRLWNNYVHGMDHK
ncbi:hypothetical protein SEPCBS119000_000348 [Sporothrix epigloea]|uniref:Conidiation-specific protein n=1 Tax=Sporothrix epigloea TaxID=1892477 RepID=A0ABP0D4P6_9PEZI